MDIREEEFEKGCEGAFWLEERAWEKLAAQVKRYRELKEDPNSNCVERGAAYREAVEPSPLWQRICGMDPSVASIHLPAERREGLKKLIRAFERMYRAELRLKGKSPSEGAAPTEADVPAPVADALIPGASRIGEFTEPANYPTLEELQREANRFPDGTRSFAGRSKLFDPLPEICAYLGIAERKLSQLCRQQTGLRIYEVADCIRVENLRTHLREKFRGLVREWKDSLDEKREERLRGRAQEAAWEFIRWMRGCGRGETRRKLGWEVGIPTPARLGRAAFVVYGVSLEEEEVRAAKAVLAELEERPEMRVPIGEHGACSSDVPLWEKKTPFEDPGAGHDGDGEEERGGD